MKQIFCVLFAALLALPGCISQRRIAETVRDTAAQIDSIVKHAPRLDTVTLDTYVLPTLTDTIAPVKAPVQAPIVVDTLVPIPVDTTALSFALDSTFTAPKVFDTGAQIVTVEPVTDSTTGAVTVNVKAITKPRNVPVQVIVPTPEPEPVQPTKPTWLHFLLFIIAGIGLSAQMFLRWQQQNNQ